MQISLLQSITATLAFFDQFDHPLTLEELAARLWEYPGDVARDELLQVIEASDALTYTGGYVVFAGREETIASRESRVALVEKKMEIAEKGAKKLRWVPFVRAVFVCNTLSMGVVTEESDVDFLVVTKRGRIWIARFFSNIILKLFRLRTGRGSHADKICLSFFLAQGSLNVSETKISDDVYLAYWLDQLIPVYDPADIHGQIRRENAWVKRYVPHGMRAYDTAPRWAVSGGGAARGVRNVFEKMWKGKYGDHVQAQMKAIQMQKFSRRGVKGDGTHVIINEHMIKLHENDRREQYRDAWKQGIKEYGQAVGD